MKVKLHQDVEGHKRDDEIEVDEARANWLVSQGYASIEGDETDKSLVTGVPADQDPTLAANQPREDAQDPDRQPEAHEVFANMVKDEETGESVNIATKAPMQSLGNTEATKSQQAQDELAAAGRRTGDEGTALPDRPEGKDPLGGTTPKTATQTASGRTTGTQAQTSTTKDAGSAGKDAR